MAMCLITRVSLWIYAASLIYLQICKHCNEASFYYLKLWHLIAKLQPIEVNLDESALWRPLMNFSALRDTQTTICKVGRKV